MSIKRYSAIIGVVLSFIATCIEAQAYTKIFKEKGKFGLMDTSTGKVILKAKYDSISDFKGNEALIWKKGKCGVILQNGTFALKCDYGKVVLPCIGMQGEKRYYWATKDGVDYYKYANDRHYTKPYLTPIYGPNGKWYAQSKESGIWEELEGFKIGMTLHRSFNPKVTKLSNNYTLFNNKLYSLSGKELIDNVGSVKNETIGGRKFQMVKTPRGSTFAMIEVSNGHLWIETNVNDVYKDTNKNGNELVRIEKGQLCDIRPLQEASNLFIIEDPRYQLLGIQDNNKRVLPFMCTNIYWSSPGGKIDNKTVKVLNLEMANVEYEPNLEQLQLKDSYDKVYLISVKNKGVSNLYNSKGDLLAEDYGNLAIKNNMLTFLEDGEEERMDRNGHRQIGGYDSTFEGSNWGLNKALKVVKKDGKYGVYQEGYGEIIPPIYDEFKADDYHLKVRKGSLEGLYDKNGNLMIQPQYKSIRTAYNVAPEKNYYIVESTNGSKALLNKNGKVLVPFGTYDSYDFGIYVAAEKWCSVYKNGKLGILDLTTFKNTVPCLYEPGTEQTSNERWPNRKIALVRKASNGNLVVDVYRMTGGKIASKSYPDDPDEAKWMLYFMERQLGVSLHMLNW